MQQLRQWRSVRYFAASAAALLVDYALTLLLFHAAHFSLTQAAATSFAIVGVGFYLVHEFWTFRDEGSRLSFARLAANISVLLLAGSVRIGIIALLNHLTPAQGILVTLYFGAGVVGSFSTNYLLNRYVVFRR